MVSLGEYSFSLVPLGGLLSDIVKNTKGGQLLFQKMTEGNEEESDLCNRYTARDEDVDGRADPGGLDVLCMHAAEG